MGILHFLLSHSADHSPASQPVMPNCAHLLLKQTLPHSPNKRSGYPKAQLTCLYALGATRRVMVCRATNVNEVTTMTMMTTKAAAAAVAASTRTTSSQIPCIHNRFWSLPFTSFSCLHPVNPKLCRPSWHGDIHHNHSQKTPRRNYSFICH